MQFRIPAAHCASRAQSSVYCQHRPVATARQQDRGGARRRLCFLLRAYASRLASARCRNLVLLAACRRGAGSRLQTRSICQAAIPSFIAGGSRLPATSGQRLSTPRERACEIYGECGGYMVLGEGLVDVAGERHQMLGLLPVVTSYEERKRHLGYRRVQAVERGLLRTADDRARVSLFGRGFRGRGRSSVSGDGCVWATTSGKPAFSVDRSPDPYMHLIDLAEGAR